MADGYPIVVLTRIRNPQATKRDVERDHPRVQRHPGWRGGNGAMPAGLSWTPSTGPRSGASGKALRPWPVRHNLRGLIYARLETGMAIREAA